MIPEKISIKKSKTLYIVLSVLFTGTILYTLLIQFSETSAVFYEQPYYAIPFAGFLLGVTGYCIYSIFDKKDILTFTAQGITYKKKVIQWEHIREYKTVETPGDNLTTTALVLTLNKPYKRQFNISLLGLSTNEAHIRECIRTYTEQSIIDGGHIVDH